MACLLSVCLSLLTPVVIPLDRYLSIQELEELCLSGPPGQPSPCQDAVVGVVGRVDPLNVFDKATFPNLPYEKFRLVDARGQSVEAVFDDRPSGPVFPDLKRLLSSGPVSASVRGRLEVVELPMGGEIGRGLRIRPERPQDVRFEH